MVLKRGKHAVPGKMNDLLRPIVGTSIVGAAAAVARYRYQAAIAAETETGDEEVLADSSGSKAAPVSPDATQPTDPKATDQGAETSVNGRVTSTGW